ncbi:universal stress protein [Pyrococcus sp. ST04]|uniref:universal stress protein n=1 Tax=Pyrococcus sp. ST04 TaxID=1183377 RepID=UPI001ED9593E|nr:universal stress protein [Pyrococcus sp. ST04]
MKVAPLGLFSNIILRKFRNIAPRYEEIVRAYKEFLLTEEEFTIPKIEEIILPLDRYSEKPTETVLDYVSAYPGSHILILYVIDGEVCRLIRETIGEEEAELFRKKELEKGEKALAEAKNLISSLNMEFSIELKLKTGNKAEIVENIADNFDLIIISKHYGAETTKTHPVSPIVLRVLQNVKIPVLLY